MAIDTQWEFSIQTEFMKLISPAKKKTKVKKLIFMMPNMLYIDYLENRPRGMSEAMIDVGSGNLEAASLDYLVEILTSEKDYSTRLSLHIFAIWSNTLSLFRQNGLRHVLADLSKFRNAGSIIKQIN
jgi:hypothetical protein